MESWDVGADDASPIMRLLSEMNVKLDLIIELLEDDDEEEA